jgi:hypothetical protein
MSVGNTLNAQQTGLDVYVDTIYRVGGTGEKKIDYS